MAKYLGNTRYQSIFALILFVILSILYYYYYSNNSYRKSVVSIEKLSLRSIIPHNHTIFNQVISLDVKKSRNIQVDGKTVKLPRIVVSLSTFVGRLEPLEATIQSLLNQSMIPDMIYVHIPTIVSRTRETDQILQSKLHSQLQLLESLQRRYNHTIYFNFIDFIDYGPSMKLIGSLQLEHNPNTIIITTDDDCTYHFDVVKQLVLESFRRPENSISTCCEILVTNPKSKKLLWDSQTWQGECLGWLKGFQGALYKVSFFKDRSLWEDYKLAPQGCKYHDDVWISGILRQHGVKPWMIVSEFKPVLKHVRHKSLSINVMTNREKYQEDCIHYFDNFRFDPQDSKWQQSFRQRHQSNSDNNDKNDKNMNDSNSSAMSIRGSSSTSNGNGNSNSVISPKSNQTTQI